MFSSFTSFASTGQVPYPAARLREIPPPTPIKFPDVLPKSRAYAAFGKQQKPLVTFLRTIQRPGDVKIEHLEALGLHVTNDVPLDDLIPDPQYLPSKSWISIPADIIQDEDTASSRILNNGRSSPGAKTYVERVKELSVQNASAFRTIRRIPAPSGETNARLGNAYEFFKNLELMSSFWDDTSQPPPAAADDKAADTMDIDSAPKTDDAQLAPAIATAAIHDRVQYRTGTGAQTPNDFRQNLLSALVKLVAYDFGCNVSHPRVEPRLFITPPPPPPPPNPKSTSTSTSTSTNQSAGAAAPAASSFPTNVTFVYRTPTDRSAARSGVVEGPLVALSARQTTGFATELDCVLDLAREAVAVLVTAQQRARESKEERKLDASDAASWWCHKPRWGGGTGGPIGREAEKDEVRWKESQGQGQGQGDAPDAGAAAAPGSPSSSSSPPSPMDALHLPHSNRDKKRRTMTAYDNYRMVRPPSSTWDRKTRYMAIGKVAGADVDEVFLVSCLNHHVAVARVRVGMGLLGKLEGEAEAEAEADGGDGSGRAARDECSMYRSRWYDMFVAEERVEAMSCIWGMMGYLMRQLGEDAGKAEL